MQPKVSIIIPTYNVEQYLRQCMDSVVNQTLKEIEIICINDGSTDGSLSILQEYAEMDSRIIVVDKINEGYGVGMNCGFDLSTGEYLGIVEPDDFVPLNMFGDLYEIASKNDLDFVKADFYRFVTGENGEPEKTLFKLSSNIDDYNKVFNPSETPDAMRYVMNTWSGIYRRDFLSENKIYHNTTPGASYQDNGFWFQTFVFAKRAMIIDIPYYMNRRDNMSSSVHNPQKVYCMNVEYDHIRAVMAEHPDLWERFKYMYWYKKYYSYDMTLNRIGEEFRKEYVQRISKEFKRGMLRGELDSEVFSAYAWQKIILLIKDPDKFYKDFYSGKEILEKTNPSNGKLFLKQLRSMIGSVLPKPIKKAIKKLLKI